MLETCGSPLSTDKRDKPVLIDHTSAAVVDFLDLMYLGDIKGTCTWKRCETLLSIIDRYDAPKLGGLVTLRLFEVVAEAPWRVFAVASQMGNTALAKVAIAKFPPQLPASAGALQVTSITNSMVRLNYLLGLVNAIQTVKGNGWKTIAEYFTPL